MILSIQRMPADNVFPAFSSRVERCSPKSVFDILTYIQFKVPRPVYPA